MLENFFKTLFYGSGEYTRQGESPVKEGWHFGKSADGKNTIDTPQGHYVQTGKVASPHAPDWTKLK